MNGTGRASWQGDQLRSPGQSMERERHFYDMLRLRATV